MFKNEDEIVLPKLLHKFIRDVNCFHSSQVFANVINSVID